MTDDADQPKARRPIGRPPDTAEPCAAASELAAAAIRDSGRSRRSIAQALDVSERTLGRWLAGPPEKGPVPDQARALARLLDKPELLSLWWPELDDAGRASPAPAPPGPTPDPSATGAPELAGHADHLPVRRRRRLLIGAAAVVALIAAGVLGVTASRRAEPDSPPNPTATASQSAIPVGPPATGAGATPVAGALQGVVNGQFAGDRSPAKTIGLWTKPGMADGCALDACPAGTRQAGRVPVGRTIAVSCVVADGQMLRNGASGEPGYYEDQRWVRLVPGQQVEQTGNDQLYLSNVWFLREALPQLPAC